MPTDPPPAPMLRTTGLVKRYGTRVALKGLSLSLAASSFVALLGPNGAGKSTLFQVLTGLFAADAGEVEVAGHSLRTSATQALRHIGAVFQQISLDLDLSVRRNLLYGYRRTPEQERHIQPEAIIETLNLAYLLDRGVNLLSGGERQRVALARTVLTCPRLILMDEPLTGLDEEFKLQIIHYLNKVFLYFAIPLLFISHSLLEMRLMTEQVLVVEEGRVSREMATSRTSPHR